MMSRNFKHLVLLLPLCACAGELASPYPMQAPDDAGTPLQDAGSSADSADSDSADAAPGPDDAALPQDDAAPPLADAALPPEDAAPPLEDAAPDAETPRLGCGQAPGANDRAWTLQHDGLQRTFYVHLPTRYDPARPTPVVLNFHGRASNAQQQLLYTGMNRVADREGFIAIYPEGTGSFEQTWNAGLCCGSASSSGVDDVGFTAAILDALERELCVDTRRVYATGLSNGGFFAHRLGCELADRVTAIAPVAGTQGLLTCAPARPVPVLHFHGTADNIVPYDGFAGFVSVESTLQGWRDVNRCPATSQRTFSQDEVTCQEWGPCAEGAAVQLCTVEGGGHTWPGGLDLGFFGYTTQVISASEAMWTFFSRYALP